MTWVRLDDGMPDHPKFAEPDDEDAALALWVRALCFCNRGRTDGFVTYKKVRSLSRAGDPYIIAAQLVAAGLWEQVEGGFQFHDYAEYQPLRVQLEARSAMRAAVGRVGGSKTAAKRKQDGSKAEAICLDSGSKREAKINPDPDPDPDPRNVCPARGREEECQDEDESQKESDDLLLVLARMVADGDPWAAKVEQWRQDNPGRALTENQRKVLRQNREQAARPPSGRPKATLTVADEADVQAIVEAYVEGHRKVLRDLGYVALSTHAPDALKILPDARKLVERAARGDWKPTPAEVVAHKLRGYMQNPRWAPDFALRFIFDRTEQDDLPRPKAVLPEARAAPPKLERVLMTEEQRAEHERRVAEISGAIGAPKNRRPR